MLFSTKPVKEVKEKSRIVNPGFFFIFLTKSQMNYLLNKL
jgi:hypothetical protein